VGLAFVRGNLHHILELLQKYVIDAVQVSHIGLIVALDDGNYEFLRGQLDQFHLSAKIFPSIFKIFCAAIAKISVSCTRKEYGKEMCSRERIKVASRK
jgi:hypothetical protein